MDLKVDMVEVRNLAASIENIKNQISSKLESSQTTISNLSGVWYGVASSNTITKYRSIDNAYSENCSLVVQQRVEFLRSYVGDGYTSVENNLNKYASEFY